MCKRRRWNTRSYYLSRTYAQRMVWTAAKCSLSALVVTDLLHDDVLFLLAEDTLTVQWDYLHILSHVQQMHMMMTMTLIGVGADFSFFS